MERKIALEARSVTKNYAGHTALKEVSIYVPEGCIYGLLGPNGAGKSSLIRIINQITAPDEGALFLFGKQMEREDVQRIGYLPEERGLYKKMKVGEQCIYLARLKGMSKADAKKSLQEWFKKFEITDWWNKKVETLSKGMAQKIQFITTVIHNPEILILDEPFSGFDPINTEIVKQEILRLKKEGTTIILSTHNMSSVEEICDEITLINQSEVVLQGKIEDLKAQYSAQQYTIRFEGNVVSFANAVWGGWELLNREQISKNVFEATIKLAENISLNQYLTQLLPHVSILSVKPVELSMNEIFIKVVNNNNNPENEIENE